MSRAVVMVARRGWCSCAGARACGRWLIGRQAGAERGLERGSRRGQQAEGEECCSFWRWDATT